MKKYNFYIEIKDKRERFLKDLFEKIPHNSISAERKTLLSYADNRVYIFSITSSLTPETARELQGGSIVFLRSAPQELAEIFESKNIKYFEYSSDESFVVKNAYLTAEGALAHIMLNTDESIRRMPVLLYGFGRLGKTLTKVLNDNYVHLSIATDDSAERALAAAFAEKVYSIEKSYKCLKNYKTIINTVPMIILKGEQLRLIDKNCFILDLASVPGGIDFDSANRLDLNYMHALGVPGKVTPLTAAMYLKDSILKCLNNI